MRLLCLKDMSMFLDFIDLPRHRPNNFNNLPFGKREEILEWVRRTIITDTDD